jgi:rare lipoprotein A
MNKFTVKLILSLLLVLAIQGWADELEKGVASYYADSLHGNPTASGEDYDKTAMTAAHKTLPFGTRVKVTNLDSGASAVLRINDRGPHVEGRIIDVSGAAARALDLMDSGTAEVSIEVLPDS